MYVLTTDISCDKVSSASLNVRVEMVRATSSAYMYHLDDVSGKSAV